MEKKEKNINDNSNKKDTLKNSEQKPDIYKKPKVKVKKNRNGKRNDFYSPDNNQVRNNITISISNQTHKNYNNISLKKIDSKKAKNIKKEKGKEIIKPIHHKNNRSFSQAKKNKPKKDKKNNNNNSLKNSFPIIPKKAENNTLKTEIIRKSLNKEMMPICSFHIISKTKAMLNNNEEVNLDFMNTSFNKKLLDDIKEKILKLKNQKKKI